MFVVSIHFLTAATAEDLAFEVRRRMFEEKKQWFVSCSGRQKKSSLRLPPVSMRVGRMSTL